ncbi:P-loop containing nucleoside triphosphate hydrolase protein [Gilbertella persicaria]|nr:P-loop containing nucleoside triphosphate hydrolase protein [Gilbertella persicaria]KAI8066942.1 P-loop containing nucleoside triphosphate hydrolase protein [Gilbertella persicaria]
MATKPKTPVRSNHDLIPTRKRYSPPTVSPERKARRMTIAPQAPMRTPPSPAHTNNKMSSRDRRLSYLPPPLTSRRESMYLYKSPVRPIRSPIKNSVPSARTSLMKPASPVLKKPTRPKSVLTEEQEPLKAPVMERPSTRLLDAYGIPITQRPKSTMEVPLPPPTIQQGSFEEFMASKKQTMVVHRNTTVHSELQQRIRVCVRKRPLNNRELAGQEDIAPLVGTRTIQVNAPKQRIDLTRYTEKHTFTFDEAFDVHTSNQQIYARTAKPLVEYVFTGGKATCFAHGQTGSGKTYTMLDPTHGLYVLAAQDIFRLLSNQYTHLEASVGFYEIYQGQLYDLLNNKQRLTAREDGNGNVVIAGLREQPIQSVQDLKSVFEYGNAGRTTGKTGANNKSSRSHAVLQVLLKKKQTRKLHGKLSFIDLAGSERGADRGDGDTKTRLEGAEINKSLLALKECIRALDQNKNHTPFRGSKLTQVLRDSFTGNSRTCMIATISPNNANSEHTLNTLRYADRVKQLRGESDPRLVNTEEQKTVEPTEDTEMSNHDSQSVTTSDAHWEDEVSENLFEVDFPTEVTTNALATPTSDRHYTTTEASPQRQEKYMKRLESPPAEVFSEKMEDPFFSTPLSKKPTEEVQESLYTRMRRFINLHRAQVQEMEGCLREEKKMIATLCLKVKSQYEIPDAFDHQEEEDPQTRDDFETYLNDLDDILDRKQTVLNVVKNKLKDELVEDA